MTKEEEEYQRKIRRKSIKNKSQKKQERGCPAISVKGQRCKSKKRENPRWHTDLQIRKECKQEGQ